ncbi:hypothetical protein RchiOBHm_Chr6g0281441 [Rosa chinensis]|uniref:Uncharacterized protein n=1 Tax=Rosa chinensis TaxID=74649 RepID=A0A2P6PTH9_ROSCH|nr:hypothetical protein RchiOBHm_Chr6g0281441 [Rosa chinensis]
MLPIMLLVRLHVSQTKEAIHPLIDTCLPHLFLYQTDQPLQLLTDSHLSLEYIYSPRPILLELTRTVAAYTKQRQPLWAALSPLLLLLHFS